MIISLKDQLIVHLVYKSIILNQKHYFKYLIFVESGNEKTVKGEFWPSLLYLFNSLKMIVNHSFQN